MDQHSQLIKSDLTISQKLVSTYNEIIKSATILDPVIQKLDLEITLENLLKSIMIFQVNAIEIIKISVKNEDLALVCDIANIITSVFSKEIYRIMIVDSTSTLDVASHQTGNDLALRSMKWLETVGTKVPTDYKEDDGYQYYEYNSEESQKCHKK